jgi:hypothetical protein
LISNILASQRKGTLYVGSTELDELNIAYSQTTALEHGSCGQAAGRRGWGIPGLMGNDIAAGRRGERPGLMGKDMPAGQR